MPNGAHLSDDEWLEAPDVPLADREQVKANRQLYLKGVKANPPLFSKGRQEEEIRLEEIRLQEEAESRRRYGNTYIRPGHPYYGLANTSKKPKKELTPDEIRLAREGAEFREMMQAKRAAKLAARAAEEEAQETAEFREFMQNWIATKWNGEAPDHLQKALLTGDPKDLGMLIHEWHDFKADQASRAVIASCPTGFVYFIRNGGLFKIGITENMLRRIGELTPDELLNLVRCSNFQEVERELHRRFKDVRLPQTEYFRLSDQQVQEVHQLMVKLAEFPT